MRPDLYVLDEPLANLDLASIDRMRTLLAQLKEAGKTIVVSEHRLSYLADLADRVRYIRDGRLAEEFSAADLKSLSPAELQRRGLRELDLGRVRLGTHRAVAQAGASGDASTGAAGATADTAPLFAAEHVRFTPPRSQPITRDLSLSLRRSEVVALVGRNGCCKTTLGKIIAGLVPCRQGRFAVDGHRVRRRGRSDAAYFVMQEADYQLYTDSVWAELTLGHEDDKTSAARADEALELLGLSSLKDHHPQALSGGQKQRVTIAAALVAAYATIVGLLASGMMASS